MGQTHSDEMNIPDDLQDIVIAAVRVHLALPYDAVVLPESCLIEDFGADIIDLRDIVFSISEELGNQLSAVDHHFC